MGACSSSVATPAPSVAGEPRAPVPATPATIPQPPIASTAEPSAYSTARAASPAMMLGKDATTPVVTLEKPPATTPAEQALIKAKADLVAQVQALVSSLEAGAPHVVSLLRPCPVSVDGDEELHSIARVLTDRYSDGGAALAAARLAELLASVGYLSPVMERLNAAATAAVFDLVLAPGAPGVLAAALAAAPPDARVWLRPGLYFGPVTLTQTVHLFGNRAAVLHAVDATTLTITGGLSGTLDGLVLRNRGGEYALDIQAGEWSVVGCDITAEPAWASVAVQGSETNPLITRCRIHDGKKCGLWHFYGSAGRVEDTDIYDNEDGIKLSTGSKASILNCRIFNNAGSGVYAYNGDSGGTIRDSWVYGNRGEHGPFRFESGAAWDEPEDGVSLEPPLGRPPPWCFAPPDA